MADELYAFPLGDVIGHDGCGIREGSPGMTLRDWFAGQALAGIFANDEMISRLGDASDSIGLSRQEGVTKAAYRAADAMLAARAKDPK